MHGDSIWSEDRHDSDMELADHERRKTENITDH